jgi:hypothetical protein
VGPENGGTAGLGWPTGLENGGDATGTPGIRDEDEGKGGGALGAAELIFKLCKLSANELGLPPKLGGGCDEGLLPGLGAPGGTGAAIDQSNSKPRTPFLLLLQ